VFPVSDKASDINKALENFLRVSGVKVMLNQFVESANYDPERTPAFSVRTERGIFKADALIIATGGLSYKSTGSTGDGYRFAESMGHSVTPTYPSLVPLHVSETWVGEVAGLSLKNVRCSVYTGRQKGKTTPVFSDIGEMMFTPKGVTGPLVLTASRYLTEFLPAAESNSADRNAADRNAADRTACENPTSRLQNTANSIPHPFISVDLKPGLSLEELDDRIQRDFIENINKDFANALDKLLPQSLIPVLVTLSGIAPERKVNAVTKRERLSLAALMKDLRLTPTETAGYAEAVITMGGVAVKEINPSTMMSKKAEGLFFAGEVLDVDALTGGFNLQAAFSTGYIAGKSAAEVGSFLPTAKPCN
jgi:predicted flavoprotein YhiN